MRIVGMRTVTFDPPYGSRFTQTLPPIRKNATLEEKREYMRVYTELNRERINAMRRVSNRRNGK
jgi:hypothetical protein